MNITERFLKYVSFPTMSDEASETCPSTKKQLALSRYLAEELTFEEATPDEGEFIETELIPLSRLVEMVESGEICDSKTQIAILKAARIFGI